MKRKQFLLSLAAMPFSLKAMQLSSLGGLLSPLGSTEKMPVLFMGHGSPMNAIEDNAFTKGWIEMVEDIPRPKAILVVSAHWETSGGTMVFAGEKPKMIYASIPCFQLSLNKTRDLQYHYDLARQLSFLRRKGVLILSSGNIVHNLRYTNSFRSEAPDWAIEFDEKVVACIDDKNHQPLIDYKKFGSAAKVSVNSAEHYIPLLYTLALQEEDDEITYSNHDIDGSLLAIGMRCVRVG